MQVLEQSVSDLLSSVFCLLSFVFCLLSSVFCLLPLVFSLLSSVFRLVELLKRGISGYSNVLLRERTRGALIEARRFFFPRFLIGSLRHVLLNANPNLDKSKAVSTG